MAINRTWQKRILDNAQRDGSLHTLYWYPVCTNGATDKAVTLGYAAPAIPVVPVGSDPEISRHDAHLLISLMDLPGAAFGLDLTTTALLDACGVPWFVWGEHDHVCPGCGAINGDCVCVAVKEVTA